MLKEKKKPNFERELAVKKLMNCSRRSALNFLPISSLIWEN